MCLSILNMWGKKTYWWCFCFDRCVNECVGGWKDGGWVAGRMSSVWIERGVDG